MMMFLEKKLFNTFQKGVELGLKSLAKEMKAINKIELNYAVQLATGKVR